MEVIERHDAARKKLRKYFTGKPCRKGHVGERYTTNGGCVKCSLKHAEEVRQEIREALNGQG